MFDVPVHAQTDPPARAEHVDERDKAPTLGDTPTDAATTAPAVERDFGEAVVLGRRVLRTTKPITLTELLG